MILKVDILKTTLGEQEVILTLGWDDEKKEIIVVKEQTEGTAKRFLAQKYRGKNGKLMSVKDGKRFIQELYFGVSGAYIRATKPHK